MASKAALTKKVRRTNYSRYYGRQVPPVTPGEFEFELTMRRGRGARNVPMAGYVESFEWTEDDEMMSGNVQLRRRLPVAVKNGFRIRCRVRWHGAWFELWTMRIGSPEKTRDGGSSQMSLDLKDDMDLVARGRRHYLFRKTKRRRHGWFGHDALRVAARRDGIRLGKIAKCTHRMGKIDVHGSFLDLAIKVYKAEKQKTGRSFVLRMHNGRFEAVPYRRNDTAYVLANLIRSATITEEPKVENPATVLTGKGRIGKGTAAKKVRHTEYRRDMVRRFGYVHREKDFGRVDSLADLKAQVKRELARHYKIETNLTVQHQGIPFVRRGDAVKCEMRSEGFEGRLSWVFCTGARHQVQGESYTADFDLTRTDPFLLDRERREKAARERARRRRKQRKRGDS